MFDTDPVRARLFAFLLLWLVCVQAGTAGGDGLAGGAAPEDHSSNGRTPLMAAAKAADNERIEALLEQGADVDRTNANGGTAIMYGVLSGERETVELLLRHHADVNAVARNGWTALMIASVKGYTDVARLLLEHGAEPNSADVYKWTPLMRAVYENRLSIVRLLSDHRDIRVNQRGENGVTALHIAALRGSTESVGVLLAHGADPGIQDDSGRTALDFARQNNDLRLVRMMRAGSG